MTRTEGAAPIIQTNDNNAQDEDVQSKQDLPKTLEDANVIYKEHESRLGESNFAMYSRVIVKRPKQRVSLFPEHIKSWSNAGSFPSPLIDNPVQSNLGLSFVGPNETILFDIISHNEKPTISREFTRAGPRKVLAFHPRNQVKACIVTCGGLCPGLNSVIRELVITLRMIYGVQIGKIDGIPYGYRGFCSPHLKTLALDEHNVGGIHHEGGSIIGSSRGSPETGSICDAIVSMGYNQIYIIGGDGTHKGALKISDELKRRQIMASVVGIPKTIDNDIALIDKSFGFDTAVEEAQRSIRCAKIEAKSGINGIGIVKLMGRQSGQIAMFATLASRDVDCCLIPEVDFELEGANGLFQYIDDKLDSKGHMVIVIAEGAGVDLIEREMEQHGRLSKQKDASGNKKLPNVGRWLEEKINQEFHNRKREINLKLIDPTYEIRSVPANASDNLHCSLLAQSAVHGAMHGFSGFSVGMVNTHMVLIPINEICRRGRTKVDVCSRMWHRVIATTQQPSLHKVALPTPTTPVSPLHDRGGQQGDSDKANGNCS